MGKLKLNYAQTYATKHTKDYYRGKSFHFSGKWVPNAHYVSDDYNVDFVVHGQVLLACAKSHLSTVDNEPINYIVDERGDIIGVASVYWDFVLAGINGKSTGVKIVDNYWYTCADITVPEEEQIWVNTGVKAIFEFSDLTPEEIAQLQEAGRLVVEDFINNVMTQEFGYSPERIISQKVITEKFDDLDAKIPEEASESNKLADKDFVESSVPIKEIKKNGTALPIENKVVDIPIPTKTSDLTNDSGFITATLENDTLILE